MRFALDVASVRLGAEPVARGHVLEGKGAGGLADPECNMSVSGE